MCGSTVEHFSHPQHPLRLKEDDVIEADAICSVCEESVIGSPTYTCSRTNIACQSFYLHKSCAQLPTQIVRHLKDPHPLALQPRGDGCRCDICRRSDVKFAYACEDHCDIDICVICAFGSKDRVISHQGHPEHTLTLQRQALFSCNACYERTDDYSYVCLPCDFWIHKKCATSPPIIPNPTYHHHPLTLIFSIPLEHRYFTRCCAICKEWILTLSWSYYCQKCTFFVHLKCSMSTISFQNETEENVIVDSDLVQFPLLGVESLFDFIITQCSKFQFEIQDDGENRATIPTGNDEPRNIVGHWSHSEHPLELLQFTISVDDHDDDDNSDNDGDKRALICDGCVQPITISHPNYYACVECGFFLHSFCANKLPSKLPAGASPLHPQHSLLLNQLFAFYSFVTCGICNGWTNGFYYECKTCDIKVDIRCVFLPTRIMHQSHKHHSLIQRPSTGKMCRLTGYSVTDTLVYACENCSSFEISTDCVFYPSRIKHKYDDHSLILRLPPFFYEGVFYCQICEEQVNNQWWLYHCGGCDQSFHNYCLCSYDNVKTGGTIKHSIDNQSHTLALLLKTTTRRKSQPFSCAICGRGYTNQFFFECDGCGYLLCIFCARRVHGE